MRGAREGKLFGEYGVGMVEWGFLIERNGKISIGLMGV